MRTSPRPSTLWPPALLLLLLTTGCRGALTNDVTTGSSKAYPDLRVQVLPLDPQAAMRLALDVARSMPRWTDCALETPTSAHCEATTPSGRFTDDVWLTIEPEGEARSRLIVRSASRVGLGDMGTNARRIRTYQVAVEGALTSAPPPETDRESAPTLDP